ncbi:MAG: hypothetical protein NTY09_09395 [bacterium]|nr:hypothetical protein [bacterium]
MINKFAFLIVCAGLLLIQVPSNAQINLTENTPGAGIHIDFTLYFSSLQLALETWDNEKEPDSVKLEAYKRASGYLAGIPFHFENNRDRLTIIEQVDTYANEELVYKGFQMADSGYYEFNYTLTVLGDVYSLARVGTSIQVSGLSDLEDSILAREEARNDALKNAARAAIRAEYTDNNKPIPGVVDGRIMWYDTVADQVDPESGLYTYNIDAWVSLDAGN